MRQKRNHRVPAQGTRARIRGLDTPVVNLSLGGACLVVAEGLAQQDARFPLELGHPHVPEKAALQAEVVWTTGDDGGAKAGVRFLGLGAKEKLLLRRCMLAEYGHGVWATPGADRPVGYVVPIGNETWGLFDLVVKQVAVLRREGAKLLLALAGPGSQVHAEVPVPSLAEAAARSFGLPRAPRIHPPLERSAEGPAEAAPPDVPSFSGSSVIHRGQIIGYVARTGESWSFFDAQREPLGFMTQAGVQWRVVTLGANEDGSLDVKRTASYPEALAAAFGLDDPPELRGTVFQPVRLLDM